MATLSQLRLARGDQALIERIILAADKIGVAADHARAGLTRILDADLGDESSLAKVYEYHWTATVQRLAAEPADREATLAALARIGASPVAITDAQIEQAVAAVLTP